MKGRFTIRPYDQKKLNSWFTWGGSEEVGGVLCAWDPNQREWAEGKDCLALDHEVDLVPVMVPFVHSGASVYIKPFHLTPQAGYLDEDMFSAICGWWHSHPFTSKPWLSSVDYAQQEKFIKFGITDCLAVLLTQNDVGDACEIHVFRDNEPWQRTKYKQTWIAREMFSEDGDEASFFIKCFEASKDLEKELRKKTYSNYGGASYMYGGYYGSYDDDEYDDWRKRTYGQGNRNGSTKQIESADKSSTLTVDTETEVEEVRLSRRERKRLRAQRWAEKQKERQEETERLVAEIDNMDQEEVDKLVEEARDATDYDWESDSNYDPQQAAAQSGCLFPL